MHAALIQMLFEHVTQSFVREQRLRDEPKDCLHRRLLNTRHLSLLISTIAVSLVECTVWQLTTCDSCLWCILIWPLFSQRNAVKCSLTKLTSKSSWHFQSAVFVWYCGLSVLCHCIVSVFEPGDLWSVLVVGLSSFLHIFGPFPNVFLPPSPLHC